MVAVTLLPYATAPRAAIAGVQNPSLAGALEAGRRTLGRSASSPLGVLVSVLGAYLAWSLICAEVLFAAAKSQDMPRLFAAQNGNRVPANALWLTNIVVSLFVISTYWSRDAFNFMLDMTSVTALLPYLLVAGYGVLLARSGEGYETTPQRAWTRPDLRLDCRSLHALHVRRRRAQICAARRGALRAGHHPLRLGAAGAEMRSCSPPSNSSCSPSHWSLA